MALRINVKYLSICILLLSVLATSTDEGSEDFEVSESTKNGHQDARVEDPAEIMIAEESRQYKTMVKPPINFGMPQGITNSHRPQYNIDSFEQVDIETSKKAKSDDIFDTEETKFEATTKKGEVRNSHASYFRQRLKEEIIRDAVFKALERKDHYKKFVQVLPIIRAMSRSQRVALASLVANQVSTPPGRSPLNLNQVRSMFREDVNATTDLMLPILLDMANLIRRASRSGHEKRDLKHKTKRLYRRSISDENDEDTLDDNPFDTGYQFDDEPAATKLPTTSKPVPTQFMRSRQVLRNRNHRDQPRNNIILEIIKPDPQPEKPLENKENITLSTQNSSIEYTNEETIFSSEAPVTVIYAESVNSTEALAANSSLDLAVAASNQTTEDLPIAEKFRGINRFLERKGAKRPPYPAPPNNRRLTADPVAQGTVTRRRIPPARKLLTASDQSNCELFTNSVCLNAEDYPTDAILLSIRRNKAAAGALLADYKQQAEGVIDGVSAAQEAKYTPEHYLNTHRRGDSGNVRDFASAGEAGFMCPSTVKYARPQRARATSGQWKYIVNTGEHTQTLRLEKCLKPKEPCTYLTDNFKSKCVQVYNYHRLLTWDQQNGLHMDIFKVPTCCSCHIEGYSVSFPPLGNRVQETSSENFPGEDLSPGHGNGHFEQVQSTVIRPSITKKTPFSLNKPVDSFSVFGDGSNLIPGAGFSTKFAESEDASSFDSSQLDSYGNSYLPDSFNQGTTTRTVKRPPSKKHSLNNPSFDATITLPSYLEPPTQSVPSSFFIKNQDQPPSKFKQHSHSKRGNKRPSRRPIRKKISEVADDLISSGSSIFESHSSAAIENLEDFNDQDEFDVAQFESSSRRPLQPVNYVSTEHSQISTMKPDMKINMKDSNSNQKRVNYNYHPIIDFFENNHKSREDEAEARNDSELTFVAPDSEWKPINKPGSTISSSSPAFKGSMRKRQ